MAYQERCPFCNISRAYPFKNAADVIPARPDPSAVEPSAFVLLSTPQVVAFLDILPIAPGHILLTTRDHFEKLHQVESVPSDGSGLWKPSLKYEGNSPAQALGFWLPLVCRALVKTVSIQDWNVVQNNGARAAQVVPHVHFHVIPRYPEGRQEMKGREHVDVGMLKSWKVFGRGGRGELDDDEAIELSASIREQLRVELHAAIAGQAML